MPAAPVLRIETSNIGNDCAVLALARYLGLPYFVVLQHAVTVLGEPLTDGLTISEMKQVAAALGTPLTLKRQFDPDESYGIAVLHDHTLVLRNGLAFDADGRVWDWDEWHAAYQASKRTKAQRGYLRLLVEKATGGS